LKISCQEEVSTKSEQVLIDQEKLFAFHESKLLTASTTRTNNNLSSVPGLSTSRLDLIPDERLETDRFERNYKGVHKKPLMKQIKDQNEEFSDLPSPSAVSIAQGNVFDAPLQFSNYFLKPKVKVEKNWNLGVAGELGRASKVQRASMLIALEGIDQSSIFISDLLSKCTILQKSSVLSRDIPLRMGSKTLLKRKSRLEASIDERYKDHIQIKETELISIKLLYKYTNKQMIDQVLDMLYTSRPIRDALPSLFEKQSDISNFKDIHERQLEFPLNGSFNLRLFSNLKSFPEKSIQHYFGEKIALYLSFSCAYRDWLVPLTILGIFTAIITYIYNWNRKDEEQPHGFVRGTYEASTVILSIFLTIWSSSFLEKWIVYQQQFTQRFGLKIVEHKKEVRTKFKGLLRRSCETDQMNIESEDNDKSRLRFCSYLLFVLAFTTLAITISCYILELKRIAVERVWMGKHTANLFDLDQAFWNIMELIRMKYFQFFFVIVVKLFTRWLNFKYVEDHERMVVVTLVAFQLVNNSLHLLVIGANQLFASEVEEIDSSGNKVFQAKSTTCSNNDCNKELQYFFAVYCIFQLCWYLIYRFLIKRARYFIKSLLRRLKKKKGKHAGILRTESSDRGSKPSLASLTELRNLVTSSRSRRSTYLMKNEKCTTRPKKSSFGNIFSCLKVFVNLLQTKGFFQNAEVASAIETQYRDPATIYEPIDEEINAQIVELDDFDSDIDFDETVFWYLRIVDTYTYITLFGVLFPLSFLTSWIISAIDIRAIRSKLIHESKRPKPSTAKTIGRWLEMLSIVSQMAVFTNSFIVAVVLLAKKSIAVRILLFVAFIVVLHFGTSKVKLFFKSRKSLIKVKERRAEFVEWMLFGRQSRRQRKEEKLQTELDQTVFDALPEEGERELLFEMFEEVKENYRKHTGLYKNEQEAHKRVAIEQMRLAKKHRAVRKASDSLNRETELKSPRGQRKHNKESRYSNKLSPQVSLRTPLNEELELI